MTQSLTSINRQALLFFLLALITLSLSRVINLFVFGEWQDINNFTSKLDDLFIMGLRFDLKVIASILLIFVYLPVLIFIWFDRWIKLSRWTNFALIGSLLILVTLSFVEFGYLTFFGTPIDILIFGLLEDDTTAVISSITGDWRLMGIFAGCLVSLVIAILMYRKLNSHLQKRESNGTGRKNIVIIIISILILAGFARGSFGTFPLSQKNSSISHSNFLNSLVMNSPLNLFYASKNRSEHNIFSQSGDDILKQARVDNIDALKQKAGFNKQKPLIRITQHNSDLAENPPHVIFIQMEGWSTHIALQHFEDNQILGEFSKHAEEDHFFPRFFSNAYGTNPTIEHLLLNSPVSPVSQSSASKSVFRLSNVWPYKENNYSTIFISGGFGAWRNHNKFWMLQGFDQYIGRSTIEAHYDVSADNPWGVYEEYLFEYLFEYLKEELLEAQKNNKPLFSFVLTTNNHPPVKLPSNYKAPPLNLERYNIAKNDDHKLKSLTGYHYQSDQLGKFLTWLKQSDLKDEVIVVATGDHILKGFYDYSAINFQFMRYAVPAYFYIPEKLDKLASSPKSVVGSHVDLFPTMFELSLSETKYYAFGTPIMEKEVSNSFGWIDQGAFLFDNGLLNSRTAGFFQWSDNESYLLAEEAQTISTFQNKVLEQHRYKSLLKQWLLLEDYRNARRP